MICVKNIEAEYPPLSITAGHAYDSYVFCVCVCVFAQVPKESRSRYATTGLGLTSRVVGTDPTFKRLDTISARKSYKCVCYR